MTTNWYSILMLIGPSGAGKSYFYQNVLLPQLEELRLQVKEPLRVVYLSSDEIRRQILGFNAHKMSPEMMAASSDAFKILTDRLVASTSYPNNAHLVVIDSTGLSEDFRKEVAEIARQGQYNLEAVVFDYKEMDEYLPEDKIEDEYSYQQKRVTMDHVKRLRTEVLKTLGKKTYAQVHKIKSKADMVSFKLDMNVAQLNRPYLPKGTYTVIGDIHGCYEELLALLSKLKVEIQDGKILSVPESVGRLVLIGDLVDKGFHSGKVVEFVHANLDKFLIVQGNHEHWVVEEFKKSSGLDEDFKKEYFNSFYELTPIQKQQLIELYATAYNFIKTPHMILTHAPVLKKHLGKFDSVSQKLQRKTPFMKSKKDFEKGEDYVKYAEEQFSYLQTEKHRSHPYHIFGHTTFPRAMKWENKIAIDSGCVYGGFLTAVTVSVTGRISFTSIKTKEQVPYSKDGIIAPFTQREVKLQELTQFDQDRIKTLAKNKIQFVSGTIAPADRDMEQNDLESLALALKYYIDKGEKEVVLETKHMGSRCNLYLSQTLSECRAVSRNGFLIKLDLTEVFMAMQTKFKPMMDQAGIKTLILDGELMPWSALGKGLIDEQYKVVGVGVKSELAELKDAGFMEAFNALQNHEKKAEFDSEVHTTSKAKLVSKYGYQLYHSLSSLPKLDFNLESDEKHIEAYIKQVDLYGKEHAVEFLPFMWLKKIYLDGSEEVGISTEIKTKDNYQEVSSKPYLVLDLKSKDYLVQAQKFFTEQVKAGEEGIVIKPEYTFKDGLVPFIKVRNKEYLRIIYGYNYLEPSIYSGLVATKKVGKKMRISQNEYRIAKQMLEIPEAEISVENPTYASLVAQMIAEEQEEQKVDYRL
jgi:predicted kinase